MTQRYTLVRISPTMIHLLDHKHGGLVAAHVFQRTTVAGTGWKLAPLSSARLHSRKLHATPEDAIASMKYMSRAEAKAALGGS